MFPWGTPTRLLSSLLARFSNKTIIANTTSMHLAVKLTYPKHPAYYFTKIHSPLYCGDSSSPPSGGATASYRPSMQNPWLLALQKIQQTFDLVDRHISHRGEWLNTICVSKSPQSMKHWHTTSDSKQAWLYNNNLLTYLAYLWIGVFVRWTTCLKFNYLPSKEAWFSQHWSKVQARNLIPLLGCKCTCFH